jgi:hypothetical protein
VTSPGRGARTTWAAGLAVAAGAGVATAHGLYQVATSARVPPAVGWLYPLITDGLALVAYAATARLHDGGRRYAAGIVILAAGLSGLAQAVYLAGGLDHTAVAPVGLRFGVGAWPAIAAALTAHLLHLISTGETTAERPASNAASTPAPSNAGSNLPVQPRPLGQRPTPPVQPDLDHVDAPAPDQDTSPDPTAPGSARDRARAAARRHRDAHGDLPTATELAQLAGTSRGTAGNALKDLRTLHLVNANPDARTPK